MSATILVLEDDSALRELLCDVLQDEGHYVVASSSLALLSQVPHDVDLLITDLLLSTEEDGLAAINTVRAATRPGLPALICSGAKEQIEQRRSEIDRLGAQLLEKPFTIDDLVAQVNYAMLPGTELQASCA